MLDTGPFAPQPCRCPQPDALCAVARLCSVGTWLCTRVGSTPRDAYPVGPRPQRSTPEHVHEIVLVTSWVSSWLNRDIVPSRSRSAAAKRDSGPQSAAAGVNATFSQASTCSAMHGMQSRSALFGRAVGSLSSICPMSSRRGAL